ncbi:DsbA family oxidoreductase [Psychromonas sp. Urea-02u-13]|uniref:DsbA family oxidoreductase n=1 Tax=Psychromonas sp. Urea-02u-13 TaxID=2058326 RepID=UPI000C33E15E|nr:DsbA family oxidoreductase [Psychromonas sp. Urea-02u-13]PKG40917.1 thioredoxin [Psychromonas sp. Urea-02u-13]
MSKKIQLDIISDVVCPWCVIGYKNLQLAIDELNIAHKVDLKWQPFELNPSMPAEGQNLREHITEKYGSTLEDSIQARNSLSDRGLQVGFVFNFFEEMKIVNTRDAHILLEYAFQLGKQTAFKLRLFSATFTEQKDVSKRDTLLQEASKVGLDVIEATARLDSETYRKEVVEQEMFWQELGVSAVPTVVFNRNSAMSGAQSVETYKQALTELLAE